MFTRIGRMILLVKDYEEALSFYVGKLGFEKMYDETVSDELRYVHVGVPGQEDVGLWMLKAGTGEKSLVGRQAGDEQAALIAAQHGSVLTPLQRPRRSLVYGQMPAQFFSLDRR